MHGTQVVLVDCRADCPSQARSCVLVSSKMYAAIDACVVDIVVNLLKRGVLQNDGGHHGVGQRDGVSALAVQTPQDLGAAIGTAGVI